MGHPTDFIERWFCFVIVTSALNTVVTSGIVIDHRCEPRSCSQPAFGPEHGLFSCLIGHKAECDIGEKRFRNKTTIGAFSFVFLSAIATYMNTYPGEDESNPSLSYSFKTPHGGPESLLTKAVTVDFDNPIGEDVHYHDNPRCRIFDYSNSTLTHYDIDHPRELTYRCFVGLAITNYRPQQYYYRLRFTALPSHAVTNYIVLVHREPRINDSSFKMAVAVAAIPFRRCLHIVWERPPLVVNVTTYTVKVIRIAQTLKTVVKEHNVSYGNEELEMKHLPQGDYHVQVTAWNKEWKSPIPAVSCTYRIQLSYIEEESNVQNDMYLKIVIASIVGVVVAFIMVIFVLITMQGKKQERVMIVNASDVTPTAKHIAAFISAHIKIKLDEGQLHLRDVTTTGIKKWYSDKYTTLPMLIVLCSERGAKVVKNGEMLDYHDNDVYYEAVRQIKQDTCLLSRTLLCCSCTENNHSHVSVFNNFMVTKEKTLATRLKNIIKKKPLTYTRVINLPLDVKYLVQFITHKRVGKKEYLSRSWIEFINSFLQDKEPAIIYAKSISTFGESKVTLFRIHVKCVEEERSEAETTSEGTKSCLSPSVKDFIGKHMVSSPMGGIVEGNAGHHSSDEDLDQDALLPFLNKVAPVIQHPVNRQWASPYSSRIGPSKNTFKSDNDSGSYITFISGDLQDTVSHGPEIDVPMSQSMHPKAPDMNNFPYHSGNCVPEVTYTSNFSQTSRPTIEMKPTFCSARSDSLGMDSGQYTMDIDPRETTNLIHPECATDKKNLNVCYPSVQNCGKDISTNHNNGHNGSFAESYWIPPDIQSVEESDWSLVQDINQGLPNNSCFPYSLSDDLNLKLQRIKLVEEGGVARLVIEHN